MIGSVIKNCHQVDVNPVSRAREQVEYIHTTAFDWQTTMKGGRSGCADRPLDHTSIVREDYLLMENRKATALVKGQQPVEMIYEGELA